jgi:Ras family protein T1
MGQQREHVRVVLVGDAKTGKTSLITVAASDHWPEQVPPVLPLTILPTDLLPERMPVIVIDTSSRQEDW